MTIDYYNHNAEAFAKRTGGCPVSHLREAFMALLPSGAEILDAGCGPGRDSLVFLRQGLRVTAMDASSAMVELATKTIGQAALCLPFAEINFENAFDGIWANASLLHVGPAEIDDVLSRLSRALRPGGVLYMSVKVGNGLRSLPDGRIFCDYTEGSLREMLSRHPELTILSIRQSAADVRQLDPKPWLHATVRKS